MNNRSRILFVSLCVFMLLPMCILSAFADGFDSGSGTQDDPYIIKTSEQLIQLSSSVSAGDSYEGKYIRLESDIVLNDTTELLWTQTARVWIPIGNPNTPFDGSFDGNGYSVSGAYINSESDSVGLFGVVGENGKVFSLTVVNSDMKGNSGTGGIAGVNNGSITYCYNKSIVRGETESGGIAGINNGIIANCTNSGWVGNKDNAGGIAGLNCGSIENCLNIATVNSSFSAAGGITAENRGNISKCCNTGLIMNDFGLAGSIACVSNGGSFSECYYLDGYTPDKFGTKLTESQMRDQASFVGFDFDNIWIMGEGEYLYPVLREEIISENGSNSSAESEEAATGTESDDAGGTSAAEPAQKQSYAIWVLLATLVILVIAKAIVGYVTKNKSQNNE